MNAILNIFDVEWDLTRPKPFIQLDIIQMKFHAVGVQNLSDFYFSLHYAMLLTLRENK